MGEGFNNFEQGILIACVIALTGSVFWIALAVTSASFRTIEMVSKFNRIAEALEGIARACANASVIAREVTDVALEEIAKHKGEA